MRNHDNVSVFFPARKSKIELKITMKIDILRATYLIALLHIISNENTVYLFEISRYIKYLKQGSNTCYVGLRGGGGCV